MARPTPPLSYLEELRPAFVAHLAARLSDAICSETQTYASRLGIRAPAKTHSAVLFLYKRGPATLSEMARVDGQSHQLLASRLAPLEALGLIEQFDDPTDGRRKPYRLTRTGRADAKRVEAAAVRETEAMRRLFAELDHDLIAILAAAIEALRIKPLGRRLLEVPSARSAAHAEAAQV